MEKVLKINHLHRFFYLWYFSKCVQNSLRTKLYILKQKQDSGSLGVKSELDIYLLEDLDLESGDFDILIWWKVNSPRFSFFHIWLDIYWLFLCQLCHCNVHSVSVVVFLIPLEVHWLPNVCNALFVSKIGLDKKLSLFVLKKVWSSLK